MFVCRDVISAGDVVMRDDRRFLVCGRDGDRSLLVPIVPMRAPGHRADVKVGDDSGLAPLGLFEDDVVVACGAVLHASVRRLLRVGVVGGGLLALVGRAVARERATLRWEAACGLGSTLVAQTSSSGRRLATVRYA